MKNTTHVHHVHLCPEDFQQTLNLTRFNRTLILYEAEWRSYHHINVLLLLVERMEDPMVSLGDLGPHFAQIYSIQCLHHSTLTKGELRHVNIHEYDRTVIIRCDNHHIEPKKNSTLTLLFTDLVTKQVLQMNISLCWSVLPQVTVGHCHKALFDDVPLAMLQQWLDYHLLLGIERFYIYDRTLRFQPLLQPYIQRDQVVYISFPLAKEIIYRERFNWIDQFVGKMHCLMRTRTSFQWLSTWDLDEYLNIFSDTQEIFLPRCQTADQKQCHSMLSDYLGKYFHEYYNVIIYAVNFMTKRSLTTGNSSGAAPLIIEQFQHRLTKWNDRVKYIVRPMHAEIINIHYALHITNNLTYESFIPNPSRVSNRSPQTLIRINHYPSAQLHRDDLFLAYHQGTIEYAYDPLLYHTAGSLQRAKEKRELASVAINYRRRWI